MLCSKFRTFVEAIEWKKPNTVWPRLIARPLPEEARLVECS